MSRSTPNPVTMDEDGYVSYRCSDVSKRGARRAAAALTGDRGYAWRYEVERIFMHEVPTPEGYAEDEGPYYWPCGRDHPEAMALWEVVEKCFCPGPVRRRTRVWFPRWNWGQRGVALWGHGSDRKARWFDRVLLGPDVDHIYPRFTAAGYDNGRGHTVHG